ncbi:MAG: hypothetical protein ACI9UJ_002442 [bacterium]|jgi:hypothetical protein
MTASEFYELCLKLGNKILEPKGFAYFGKGVWAYKSSEYMLAFEPVNLNKLEQFNIKFLTLVYYNYVNRCDFAALDPSKFVDKGGPIQINPLNIAEFVKSDFSDESWHYSNAYTKGDNSNTYHPLFYGGVEAQSILGKFSNKKSLKLKTGGDPVFVQRMGAEVISEDKAKNILTKSMTDIAEYGFQWAERFTPDNIIHQIETYGEGWFIEKEWIKAYKLHLVAPQT